MTWVIPKRNSQGSFHPLYTECRCWWPGDQKGIGKNNWAKRNKAVDVEKFPGWAILDGFIEQKSVKPSYREADDFAEEMSTSGPEDEGQEVPAEPEEGILLIC